MKHCLYNNRNRKDYIAQADQEVQHPTIDSHVRERQSGLFAGWGPRLF